MVKGYMTGLRFAGSVLLLVLTLWADRSQATPAAFDVCLDYHCDQQQSVQLDAVAWESVVRLFPPGLTPEGEREAIRQAIAMLERIVGRITGTWRDLAENAAGAGLPGQLDCIAESRNTTTYLHLLANAGLLRRYLVGERVRRQRWIFAIHWTAVIRDRVDASEYAVDSWPLNNGEPPVVQPLDAWRRGAKYNAKASISLQWSVTDN